MIPPQVTMIPMFLTFKQLGWINTILPLVVPAFFGNAFFIFLLRQFYRTVPRDLIEAARLDGCGELGIWSRIMLPLSRPALAVVALFTFIHSWNDFLGPLIYLMEERKYTLSIGLAIGLGGVAAVSLGAIADAVDLETAVLVTALGPAACIALTLLLPAPRTVRPGEPAAAPTASF